MDKTKGGASALITIRVPDAVKRKAVTRAKELGYIKPSGEANVSEYVRNLIIYDRVNVIGSSGSFEHVSARGGANED